MAKTTKILGCMPMNRGTFDASQSYYKNNIVQYNCCSYMCVAKGPVSSVPTSSDWRLFSGVNIVHETGDAEDKAMSQKAVTDSNNRLTQTPTNEIYASTTDNFLDIKNVIRGLYLNTTTNTIEEDINGVISRFIYVGDCSQITVSGTVNSAQLAVMLFEDANLYSLKSSDVKYLTAGTERTIDLPARIKYVAVSLVNPIYNGSFDYSNVKLSKSNVATTGEYRSVYLGDAGHPELFGEKAALQRDMDKVFNKSAHVNPTIGNSINIVIEDIFAEAGKPMLFRIDDVSEIVPTGNTLYLMYEGDSTFTGIYTKGYPSNVINSFTPERNVVGMKIYTSKALGDGAVSLILINSVEGRIDVLESDFSVLEERVSACEGSTAACASEIIVTKEDVAVNAADIVTVKAVINSYWDGDFQVVANTSYSAGKLKLKVNIKQGEKVSYRVAVIDGSVDYIAGIYKINKEGASSFIRYSVQPNTYYEFIADEDIEFITVYIQSANVVGDGIITIEVISDGGILQTIDKNYSKYNLVKVQEGNDVLKRLMPYAISTNITNPAQTSESQQWNECCKILFFTDSHVWSLGGEVDKRNVENVEDTIDFANNNWFVPYEVKEPVKKRLFDAVVYGGDVTSQLYSITADYLRGLCAPFFNAVKRLEVPFVFAPGNHDMVLTGTDYATLYSDWAEEKFGLVRQTKADGNKSSWSYYDIEDKKIRVIAIDTNDLDRVLKDANGGYLYHGSNAWYISQEQMTWLADVALNFDNKVDKDWGVVIVSHLTMNLLSVNSNVWYGCTTSPAFEGDIVKFMEVLKAFNNQSNYTHEYTFEHGFYNLNINADFTRYADLEKKPHVVCWLVGHQHADAYRSIDGINMIWTAQGALTQKYGSPFVIRNEDTSTQNCFDCLSIDTLHRKIRIVRYGAGVDCFGNGGDRFIPEGVSY